VSNEGGLLEPACSNDTAYHFKRSELLNNADVRTSNFVSQLRLKFTIEMVYWKEMKYFLEGYSYCHNLCGVYSHTPEF
jgi:hypothetical protein